MIWKSRKQNRDRLRTETLKRRTRGPERLEARRLFAADAIHVGVVYLETDYLESDQDVGSDSRGDRFILSFTGGAPGTELSELRIRTDKDGDGISVGDPIFDISNGGRGKAGAHGFEVVRVRTGDGRPIDASAEVEDGGQELVLRLSSFRAGDRLEFTLDVDEVLRNSTDLAVFNDRLDVITSGQEFQDSILEATFEAPHYETSHADALFANDFGDPSAKHGLELPPDQGSDIDSRPNRSAAAVASTMQTPKPVEISGHVWVDNDLDAVRDPSEQPFEGVEVSLWKQQTSGSYQDTGHRDTTDANGQYRFTKSLGLMPGTYRVMQQQPNHFFSVAAIAGTSNGLPNGTVESVNTITNIQLLLGDTSAINQSFAEAVPASLSGHVYRDLDNDGRRESGETGIRGIRVRLIPIQTIAPQIPLTATTAADGSYQFVGLAPGTYELIEVDQPSDLSDGTDTAGTVAGRTAGTAENPGDRIHSISLAGSDDGIEYNFAELPLGSISGFVFLAAPGRECDGEHGSSGNQALGGVHITLQNEFGETVATTVSNTSGLYEFDRVPVGNYRIVEETPSGLIDGYSHVGKIGGVTVGTSVDGGLIQDITMTPGGVGIAYDFCEAASATISGQVYHDASNDGRRDSGEESIEGVRVSLIGLDGNVVATQQTDANGRYRFSDIRPGNYTIREEQPRGYLDGIDTTGTVRGVGIGRSDGGDSLSNIQVHQGDIGVDFDFGELIPTSISGRVHVDLDGDCELDEGERTLAGVVMRLLDDDGAQVAQTTTNASGLYSFIDLLPGTYSVHQRQPGGYFDGDAHIGDAGGRLGGSNRIDLITLESGESASDYNFCEFAPSSLSGRVWSESDQNLRFDPGESPIPGVVVELLDSAGHVVERTSTNQSGEYRFSFLAPGVYSLRQAQPRGQFHGGEVVGTAGGEIGGDDLLIGIELLGGTIARDYHFPEIPPASISGHVFQDGVDLVLEEPLAATELREYVDGLLSEDDRRLGGVVLELRDHLGQPVNTRDALPGLYSPGVIRAMTDNVGIYEFVGLRPGTYHVFQVQPDNYIDGLDTAGSTGGVALNASDELSIEDREFIERLTSDEATDPGHDAILNIRVQGGESSTDNNFSELVVVVPPTLIPYVPPHDPVVIPGMTQTPSNIESFAQPIRLVAFAAPRGLLSPLDPYRMLWDTADQWGVSWHLSVINGGFPRGVIVDGAKIRSVSSLSVQPNWNEGVHSKGNWTFDLVSNARHPLHELNLGEEDAIALAGDFNGDGSDEAVIFVAGQWYVDLNGNGRWDAGDLWIQLGTKLDRPIVGDWDGDGKDDVAIFGRRWQRDDQRIIQDPGLPDPANMRRRTIDARARSVVQEDGPENQQRFLRRGTEGSLRADAVDHVFQYGERVDTPIAGDWNGDGIDQIGVFQGGNWMLDTDGDGRWTESDERLEYGHPGDEPIVGDFNGDLIDEIGVVRGDLWIIDTDGDRRITGNDMQIRVPRSSGASQPVVGDFDGDGKDEPGYYDEAA